MHYESRYSGTIQNYGNTLSSSILQKSSGSARHRLQMWRWSFSNFRVLRDNLKLRFAFQLWKRRLSWNKKLKKHLSEWASCQKAIGGIYFTKKRRAETLQPGLEFDNFKSRLQSGIFRCISWLNSSFFRGGDRGFLKEEVKTYLMAPMLPLKLSIFFCLTIYSLGRQKRQSKRRKLGAEMV